MAVTVSRRRLLPGQYVWYFDFQLYRLFVAYHVRMCASNPASKTMRRHNGVCVECARVCECLCYDYFSTTILTAMEISHRTVHLVI
jgi:hypothetical protein